VAGALLAFALSAQAHTPVIDFNGDGYTDLAVAAPNATVNGMVQAGSVTVFYGPFGLSTQSQLWTKQDSHVPGEAEPYDHFGQALVTGDFNGDRYTDLAIGVPSHPHIDGIPDDQGSVIVLYGSSLGLVGTHNFCGNPCPPPPNIFRMPVTQTGDLFGSALVAADFNGDRFPDLAIGAPGSNYSGPNHSGAVRVFYGSPTGLTETNARLLRPGDFDDGGWFGFSLAAGFFNYGTAADLAVGSASGSGSVRVFYGSSSGFSSPQQWDAGDTNFPLGGASNYFGWSLAAGRFRDGNYDDLAIGIPGATVDGNSFAGAVIVLAGSSSGLTNTGSSFWSLSVSGVPGDPEPYGYFGMSLANGNLGFDFHEDLAIGAPGCTAPGAIAAAGCVVTLYGTPAGLSAISSTQLFHQTPQQNAHFGEALAAASLGGTASYVDLAVGSPFWDIGASKDAGLVSIHYGSVNGPTTLNWAHGVLENGAHFGAALSR
jgi:hypothetical protein